MRFQSKRHKRMNGKQRDFSFMANDRSFMASRISVMVVQA